jgi:hypothetical protein
MELDDSFADCWQMMQDFRPAAQASPNPLIEL